MKMHNQTHYNTRDLWMIAYRVVMQLYSRKVMKSVELTVVYSTHRRSDSCSGYAFHNTPWSPVIRVPRNGFDAYSKLDFAFVVAHEVAHASIGEHHKEMRGGYLDDRKKGHEKFAWAAKMPIRGGDPITIPSHMELAVSKRSAPRFAVKRSCRICHKPLRVKYLEGTPYFVQKFPLHGKYKTREWGPDLPELVDSIGVVLLKCMNGHEAYLHCGKDEVFIFTQEVPDVGKV